MSSLSPPRVPAELSEPSSSRAEVSTRPLPSGRTLPVRPRRRPLPSVSPSVPVTSTRPPLRRRSSLTFTESEVSYVYLVSAT